LEKPYDLEVLLGIPDKFSVTFERRACVHCFADNAYRSDRRASSCLRRGYRPLSVRELVNYQPRLVFDTPELAALFVIVVLDAMRFFNTRMLVRFRQSPISGRLAPELGTA
jgi:hypothetical protein